MKKLSSVLLFAILAVFVISLLSSVGCVKKVEPVKENLYEKVMRTKELRAAYVIEPTLCYIDTVSGEMTGIFAEVLNEIGNKLSLNVVWVEEAEATTLYDSLQSGHYDILGSGIKENKVNRVMAELSNPVYYQRNHIWVRENEPRILSIGDIDSEAIRLVTRTGNLDEMIGMTFFPKAQKVSLSADSPVEMLWQYVIADSGDVFIAEIDEIAVIQAINPGMIKEVMTEQPLRSYGVAFAFKTAEPAFKEMIDKAIYELMQEGIIEQILQNYENQPDEFLRVVEQNAEEAEI